MDADEQRPQPPPARVLLHAHHRRPAQQGPRLRAGRRHVPLDRRRQDVHAATPAATRTISGSTPTTRITSCTRTTAAAQITFNALAPQATWTSRAYATGQFYHVITTAHVPYHVCGAQQDSQHDLRAERHEPRRRRIRRPRRWRRRGRARRRTRRRRRPAGHVQRRRRGARLHRARSEGSGRVLRRRQQRLVPHADQPPHGREPRGRAVPARCSPASRRARSSSASSGRSRSSSRPSTRTCSTPARSTCGRRPNGGQTWDAISGDLTRHDPKTMGDSGGPITHDMNSPEVYATVFAIGAGQDRRQRDLGGLRRRLDQRHARRRQDVDERHAEGHAGLRPREHHRRVGVRRRHRVRRREEAAARRLRRRTSSARTTSARRGRRSSTASRRTTTCTRARGSDAQGPALRRHAARRLLSRTTTATLAVAVAQPAGHAGLATSGRRSQRRRDLDARARVLRPRQRRPAAAVHAQAMANAQDVVLFKPDDAIRRRRRRDDRLLGEAGAVGH